MMIRILLIKQDLKVVHKIKNKQKRRKKERRNIFLILILNNNNNKLNENHLLL